MCRWGLLSAARPRLTTRSDQVRSDEVTDEAGQTPRSSAERQSTEACVGDLIRNVAVGDVAHGGHCVARVDGKVVFVRHTLPGETVDVRLTHDKGRFAQGDAVAVTEPSPDRRTPPCPLAGVCGGCDFQHATPEASRRLKARVVADQLRHLAGVDFDGSAEAVTPDDLGWRTRMRYEAAADGRPGLRRFRSHEVVPLPPGGCRIAAPGIAVPDVAGVAALTLDGPVTPPRSGSAVVREAVADRIFRVRADGFWQAHVAAPTVLTDAVLAAAAPRAGEKALDLYCGAGVFAGALVDVGCRVWGAEGDRGAASLATRNVPEATIVTGDVARVLRRLPDDPAIVVLDPPRAGAGTAVMRAICASQPRVVVYVACDPAALGRDLAAARACGYDVADVRAYDLFPNTHHVECVATLRPTRSGGADNIAAGTYSRGHER